MKIDNQKTLLWIIAILVFFNISLLAFFIFSGPKNAGPKKASDFLTEELQFDAGQKKAYQELIKNHRKQVDAILSELRKSKKAYFEKIGTGDNTDQLQNELSRKQAELEELTFQHFEDVYELGNEQQKQKFKEVIHQAMEKMAAGAPARGEKPPRQRK